MKIPFFLDDNDWKGLTVKETETLGLRADLDPEEEKLYKLFRIMDRRVEWSCEKTVGSNNAIVVIVVVLLIVNGPQLVDILIKLMKAFQ